MWMKEWILWINDVKACNCTSVSESHAWSMHTWIVRARAQSFTSRNLVCSTQRGRSAHSWAWSWCPRDWELRVEPAQRPRSHAWDMGDMECECANVRMDESTPYIFHLKMLVCFCINVECHHRSLAGVSMRSRPISHWFCVLGPMLERDPYLPCACVYKRLRYVWYE